MACWTGSAAPNITGELADDDCANYSLKSGEVHHTKCTPTSNSVCIRCQSSAFKKKVSGSGSVKQNQFGLDCGKYKREEGKCSGGSCQNFELTENTCFDEWLIDTFTTQ